LEQDDSHFDIDAEDRALAFHEAGHAVVARAVGRQVKWVEVRFGPPGGGKTETDNEEITIDKVLAICVAGSRSEEVFGVATPQITIRCEDDAGMEQRVLALLPDQIRLVTRAKGYRLADTILNANPDAVHRIVDALLSRRWIDANTAVRIERDELIALLDG
jgi:ATP-dependent Zn protease